MLYPLLQALTLGAAGLCPLPPATEIPDQGVATLEREQMLVMSDPASTPNPAQASLPPACAEFLPADTGLATLQRGQRSWLAFLPQQVPDRDRWGLRLPVTGADELCVFWPTGDSGWQTQCRRLLAESGMDPEVLQWNRSFLAPEGLPLDRPVLVSVVSQFRPIVPLEVGAAEHLNRLDAQQQLSNGLIYGVLLALLAYGLLLLTAVRDRALLYFSLHVGGFILALLLAQEIVSTWLAIDLRWMEQHGPFLLMGLAILAGGAFMKEFLGLDQQDRLARGTLAVLVTISAGLLFFGTWRLDQVWWAGDAGIMLFSVGILVAAGYGFRQGRSNALPLVIGFTLLVLTQIYNGLMRLGWVPSFGLDSFTILQAGLILAATSVAFAVGRQFSALRRQRDRASLLADTHQRIALYRSEFDTVTGLPNRQRLIHRLGESLSRSGTRFAVGVLAINLDRFRQIRSILGHEGSNEVLRALGSRLRAEAESEDHLGRLDGDEFALVVHLPVEEEAALARLRRIGESVRQRIGEPLRIEGQALETQASVGASWTIEGTVSASQLLEQADSAAYEAREQGGNCLRVYDEGEGPSLLRRWRIRSRLAEALEQDLISPHFQPIVDLKTGRILAFEALARWQDPELGEVPPSVFIPVAEQFDLIDSLGRVVADKALRTLAEWDEAGLPQANMTVNLSPRQLQQREVEDWLPAMLERHGIAGNRLIVELTENTLVENLAAAGKRLQRLAREGIGVAVDDFGVGYSALSYLRDLPLRILKIDRSFITRLGDGEDSDLVPSILEMAERLGLQVVAEGIETPAQWERLSDHGCQFGQGFLFARPLAPEVASSILEYGVALPTRPEQSVTGSE